MAHSNVADAEILFAGPVRPLAEPERLAELASHRILDTPPDERFDQIIETACKLCGTPVALVSLIDSSRQWLKASVGISVSETPRDMSLCSFAILHPERMLVVENIPEDPRFASHEMLGDKPKFKFYAGVPLKTTSGHALGTLCVLDVEPRRMTQSQQDGLQKLGDATMELLEQRFTESLSPILNSAIDKLSIGIAVTEVHQAEKSIIYCNQSFEKLSGYNRCEIIGKQWHLLDGEGTDPKETLRLCDAIENREECSATLKNYRKDGTEFWNDVLISPIQDKQGQVTHYVSVHQDATRRHLAEVRNIEFGSLLEDSLNEIYVCDIDTTKFIHVNKGGRRNLGYSMAELSEMTPMDIGKGTTQERLDAVVRAAIDKPDEKVVFELEHTRKDGSSYFSEAHLQMSSFGGRPVLLAINLDISERKHAEQMLKDANEQLEQRVIERTAELDAIRLIAEEANEGKTRFLAAASHDLRQPLQALRLYLSALNLKLTEPEAIGLGKKMRLSIETMRGLLDTLLDISALESGSVQPDKQSVRLSTLFDRLENANKQQAEVKGLEFECKSLDCIIYTDPGLVERIIENFISNAIRYTEQGQISLTAELKGNRVRISVKDSGIGVSASALNNIFDEYYQEDNPVRERKKGLGLGLSIVKHIANLLDHPTHVASKVGQGSIFSVDVPLGDELPDSIETGSIKTSVLSKLKAPVILFLDDDPDIMDAMVVLLNSFDIDLYTATNGNDALALIKKGLRPDLLVSDYRMPGMTGVEVVRAVRSLMSDELPVVLMTGDTSAATIRAEKLPNSSVFLKPISMEELMPIVDATRKH